MPFSHVFAVCAYQDSPYLEACLKSLRGQTVPSKVILCTSTPSPFLEEMGKKYSIPVYVREGESNIKDDWNFAWKMAEGDFVTLAHQDDLYHKTYTERLKAAALRFPDMTVFTGDYVMIKGGQLVYRDRMLLVKRLLRLPLRIPALNHLSWIKQLPLMLGNSICCPATTYCKRLLGEPLIHSDYQFALDWENMLRLARQPGRWICEEHPLIYYRIHDGAATKACMRDHRREREEQEMFERFWPRPLVQLLMRGYRAAYEAYK